MELVFKEELEELIDYLGYVNDEIERIQNEIEDEIDGYGYGHTSGLEYEEIQKDIARGYKDEIEDYKSELNDMIDDYCETIPEVTNSENNLFNIGKVRREEILKLLYNAKDDICNLYWDDINLLDKIKNDILEYASKDIKVLVNKRKRESRRNERGFTKREQKKQDKIDSIHKLKQQGLTQSQVRSKLNFSKSLISRYWNCVHLNGKWEIYKKNTENKKRDKIRELILEDEELILEDVNIHCT